MQKNKNYQLIKITYRIIKHSLANYIEEKNVILFRNLKKSPLVVN